MKFYIKPSEINGSVTLPASKSAAHRALIAAFLCGIGNKSSLLQAKEHNSSLPIYGKNTPKFTERFCTPYITDGYETHIIGRLCGRDVEATIGILSALGADIRTRENELIIAKCAENRVLDFKSNNLNAESVKSPVFLNAGESGSTLRFMLPVLCALKGKYELTGEGRLSERPIANLIEALRKNGAKIDGDRLPLKISGGLESGEFEVDGSISSQFVTGLLLALPLIGGGTVRAGALSSAGYIDITVEIMKAFGVEVKRNGGNFSVSKGARYRSPGTFTAEGDWSSAGFFAVAGAIAGKTELCGLNPRSAQGDKIVLEILKNAGAEVILCRCGNITVQKPFYDGSVNADPSRDVKAGGSGENCLKTADNTKLKAFRYDASDYPDSVPIMCVAAAAADGVSEIYGVDRLRYKESDRLDACIDMLTRFQIECEYGNDKLRICGGVPKGAEIPAYNDHRMTMSAAVAALIADGSSVIDGAECCDKSYPDFAEDLKRVGADIEVER